MKDPNYFLSFYAASGEIEKCNECMKQGANDFNEAILNAAMNNHIDIVKLLIMHGANNLNEVLCFISTKQVELRNVLLKYTPITYKDKHFLLKEKIQKIISPPPVEESLEYR